MKATELMLGDWVQKLEVGGHYRKCRITAIIDDTVDCETSDGEVHTLSASGIKPIPLTAEILEKNEFIHSYGDSDFYDYEKWEKKVEDKTIRVIKDQNGWFCRVDDNKLTRSMGIAPAVHTMQNIIRIGGINGGMRL